MSMTVIVSIILIIIVLVVLLMFYREKMGELISNITGITDVVFDTAKDTNVNDLVNG